MGTLSNLQPATVFGYFEEICKIPRVSGNEEEIIDYIVDFAEGLSLNWKRDKAGNLLVCKPATAGLESRRTVVLQGHVDMVGDKTRNTAHDFATDPILPYIDNGWVKARGTTLGADCGIGIAAMLALLADKEAKHGAVECLFTVDEENALTGSRALAKDFFSGKILLNLDSEDDGELFIGCAGGMDTTAVLRYDIEQTPSEYVGFRITIGGLTGGHSGEDINKGRANSIKIMSRFLWKSSGKFDFRLSAYNAGRQRNAIPRESTVVLAICKHLKDEFRENFLRFKHDAKREYLPVEKNICMEIEEIETPDFVIDEMTQFELLAMLLACPSGVTRMNPDIKGLVETSTNLAVVKFSEKEITVSTSQRSSAESQKTYISDMVASLFSLTNAKIIRSNSYPAWTPNLDSEILKITKDSYEKLFGESPKVKVVHAGLECGLFPEKYPDLDMISFGPTIRDAHSPDERLEIATVGKFWELLKTVLANIPEQR
ncbi:MAG: aminoacyl-histidine dipeptidase, partial [Prevotellaceae bacterium]|nr:aminoacyl-histidine dipeptidase [Prevotellaceae bacterium]